MESGCGLTVFSPLMNDILVENARGYMISAWHGPSLNRFGLEGKLMEFRIKERNDNITKVTCYPGCTDDYDYVD